MLSRSLSRSFFFNVWFLHWPKIFNCLQQNKRRWGFLSTTTLLFILALVPGLPHHRFMILPLQQKLHSRMEDERMCVLAGQSVQAFLWFWWRTHLALLFPTKMPWDKSHGHFIYKVRFLDQLRWKLKYKCSSELIPAAYIPKDYGSFYFKGKEYYTQIMGLVTGLGTVLILLR